MDKYADYAWYVDCYLQGMPETIPASLFDYYATMASAEVKNGVSLDADLSDPIDEVKAATCEIAALLCDMDGNSLSENSKVIPAGIGSEKVGEYSVSYIGNTVIEREAARASKVRSALVRWLGKTGLLFRGV